MPDLMRVFTVSDRIVQFRPTQPEDEAKARAATDYVNWIWNVQNDGFMRVYNWFKAALLYKVGVVKIGWETEESRRVETYEDVAPDQLALLEGDPEFEVEEVEVTAFASPPAFLLSTVRRRESRAHTRLFAASFAPFCRLICAHLLCPAIR